MSQNQISASRLQFDVRFRPWHGGPEFAKQNGTIAKAATRGQTEARIEKAPGR